MTRHSFTIKSNVCFSQVSGDGRRNPLVVRCSEFFVYLNLILLSFRNGCLAIILILEQLLLTNQINGAPFHDYTPWMGFLVFQTILRRLTCCYQSFHTCWADFRKVDFIWVLRFALFLWHMSRDHGLNEDASERRNRKFTFRVFALMVAPLWSTGCRTLIKTFTWEEEGISMNCEWSFITF